MVSRGYQAPLAERSNWITDEPSMAIAIVWTTVLVVAMVLTMQTAFYILQNGLVADRPPLSPPQTLLRIARGAGAVAFLFVRRRLVERAALLMAVVAAGSSALFGFGLRSPFLASVRLLSHLALYVLAARVAWNVLMTMRGQATASR